MRIPFLVFPFLSLFLGCADNAPIVVKVGGTVILDGVPLAHKNIMFFPEGSTPGAGAGGNTNAAGIYNVLAVRPGATRDVTGVPPGFYKVVITEPLIPVDTPTPPPSTDPAPAIGFEIPKPLKKKITIPTVYTRQETTPLKVEVPPMGGTIDLELKSTNP